MQAKLILEKNMWTAVTPLNDQTGEDDHEAPLEQQKLYVTNVKQKPTDCQMWHNLKING